MTAENMAKDAPQGASGEDSNEEEREAAADAAAAALPPLPDSPQGAPASGDGASGDAQSSEETSQLDGDTPCGEVQRDDGHGGEEQPDSERHEREEPPSGRCEDGLGVDANLGEGEGEEGEGEVRADGLESIDRGMTCSECDAKENGTGCSIACLESDQCAVSQTGVERLTEGRGILSDAAQEDKENAHRSQRSAPEAEWPTCR